MFINSRETKLNQNNHFRESRTKEIFYVLFSVLNFTLRL